MFYTELTKKAMNFAYQAHDGQIGKDGVPYFIHSFLVAEKVSAEYPNEELIAAALLHDVIEDTGVTLEELSEEFPSSVVTTVDVLTRRENESYDDYISRVSQNVMAMKIKLADIEHNSDLTRLDKVDDADIKRIRKYKRATAELLCHLGF